MGFACTFKVWSNLSPCVPLPLSIDEGGDDKKGLRPS